MKDIKQILSSLGLLDSEIKTYLASLRNGPSTVLELSKATKLSRQATYTAIEQLTNRGLISSIQRGKRQLFTAEAPDKLLAYAKRKEDDLKEKIKDLKSALPSLKLQAGGEQPVVRMYEGKEGIKAVLEHVTDFKPKFTDEIGDLDAIFAVLDLDDLKPFRQVLSKIKTKNRSIYSGTPQTEGPIPDRYFLPKKYSDFKTNFLIFPDKVLIFTFGGKIYSTVIENKEIAQTMHILFDLALSKDSQLKEG